MKILFAKWSLALVALVTLLFSCPEVIWAQVGPCPFGGPSPGYRVVGQTPAGNGAGSILLCEPTGEGRQDQTPQPRRNPTFSTATFFAFAYHPDAREVWAVVGYTAEEEAKRDSLANCTRTMGDGCILAGSGTNTSITIFEVSDGSLAWVPYHDPKDSRAVLMSCKTLVRPLNCYPKNYFGSYNVVADVGTVPKIERRALNPIALEGLRKVYGSVAFVPASNAPENNKIWVSTGHKTQSEATKSALDLCAKTNAAQQCKTGITIATGVIRVLLSREKVISFTSDLDPGLTWEFFEKECKDWKEPAKCMPKYLFDVQKQGQFEKTVQ
jgi:hypothetical protein